MDSYPEDVYRALQEDVRSDGLMTSQREDPTAQEIESLRQGMAVLEEHYNYALAQLTAEDVGWQRIFGSQPDDYGMSLEDVKEAAKVIRLDVDRAPLIGRAADLRQSYIWGKGVKIKGVEPTGEAGRPTAAVSFFNDPQNQEQFFGEAAKPIIEKAASTDGNFLLLGNVRTRKLRQLPFLDIENIHVNPDYPSEVWAYLRVWTDQSKPSKPIRKVWYYTDKAPQDKRLKSLPDGSGSRPLVDPEHEIIDARFNRQLGNMLGVPDLFAAVGWNRSYIRAVKDGQTVTSAHASIAFKATANTQAGADNMGVKLAAGGQGRAKVAITGTSQSLDAIPQSARGYDFGSLQALAALVATSARVSVIHLLSSPGAAGSSYGAAANLDRPTLLAMKSRQNEWVDFIKRLFTWAGAKDVQVWFPSLDDDATEKYREAQATGLVWSWGALHVDELRKKSIDILDIESLHDSAPDGVMLPNNTKFAGTLTNDTQPQNGAGFTDSQGSPSQFGGGRPNGEKADDTRTDIVSD